MARPPNICYWCGAPATSREHAPPRNLFSTEELHPITVPSCRAHNEAFHSLDERLRVYLQGCSQSAIAAELFRDKTARGLRRSPGLLATLKAASTPATLNGQPSNAIGISASDVHTYFEKVNRALYFHHYSEPFPGDFNIACSHIHAAGHDFRRAILVYHEVNKWLEPGRAAHPNIFRYEIARVVEPGGTGAFIRMTFYGDITVFSIGTHEAKIV